jgi:diguanylate cyclase (GGDEF)-like protein
MYSAPELSAPELPAPTTKTNSRRDSAMTKNPVTASFVENQANVSTKLHDQRFSLKADQKISPEATDTHATPVGYLDTVITLMGEYKFLFKSLRQTNDVLEKRITDLQAELVALAKKEVVAQHLAYHDALTGLPNRSLLQDRFDQAISQAERHQKPLAILLLDLDKFKHVNDQLGHASGDKLLQAVALRLTNSVRGADTACRYGGDEFVIMLPIIESADSATLLAAEIGKRLTESYILDGHNIHMSVSLGMAIYPDDGKTLDELIKKADIAMYRAKGKVHSTRITAIPEHLQRA